MKKTQRESSRHVSRVLLVALEGGSYDVLVPLAEAGTMPNFARLLQSSALARLRSPGPQAASAAWATLETGSIPPVHGRLDDCYLDHRRRRILPARCRPVGRPTLVEQVNGADRHAPAIELTASVAASVFRDRPSDFAELARGIAQTQCMLRGATAAAARLDRSREWRLLQVRFTPLARLLCRLWNLLGIGPAGGNPRWIAKTRETLRTLDDCLGQLLEIALRRDAAVIVVSPQGYRPFRERITLPELLRRRGLLLVAGATARIGYRISRLSSKAGRRLPWAPWRAGEPIRGLLPVDWRRSAAVSLHGRSAALAYLNTPRRFGGRVLPTARSAEQAAAEVLAALREARHPVTQEPLFREAWCVADRSGLDPVERCWPEVIAVPAAGFLIRHRLDRKRRLLRDDPSLLAVPGGEGLLMVCAPGVRVGQPCTAELDDVAPTVLHLLGLPPSAAMTGRPLKELFTGRCAFPPRRHARYAAPADPRREGRGLSS